MDRQSFIFYRSFYEAARYLPDKDRLKILDGILSYSLDWDEPIFESNEWMLVSFWTLILPQIDANIRRYENGSKWWRPKPKDNQKITKKKPNKNLDITKQEPNKNDNDNVNDNDNKNNILPTVTEQALKTDNRNPEVQKCIDTIKAFCKEKQILYDSGDDRMFAKHIVTAKEFWEKAEQFWKDRIELAILIIEIAERDTFWRGKIAWPKNIYQKATQILNLGRSMYLQEQEPNTHYQII